ncbi:MAG: PEP-CTERM sorting domain-containing protein [Planctomycetota bacterium]
MHTHTLAIAAASTLFVSTASAGVITFDPADGFPLTTSLDGKPNTGSPQWSGNGSLYTLVSRDGVSTTDGAAQSDATSPATFAPIGFTPDAAFLGAASTAATGQFEYGFELRNDTTPNSEDFAVAHRIFIGQAGDGTAIRINIFDNGQVELAIGGGTVRVQSPTANFDLDDATGRYIPVAGVIDFDTSTYTLSFDGVQQTANGSADLPFNASGQTGFGSFVLQQGGSTDTNARQITIDNLSAAVPEPASVVLLSLGALLLARRRQ